MDRSGYGMSQQQDPRMDRSGYGMNQMQDPRMDRSGYQAPQGLGRRDDPYSNGGMQQPYGGMYGMQMDPRSRMGGPKGSSYYRKGKSMGR